MKKTIKVMIMISAVSFAAIYFTGCTNSTAHTDTTPEGSQTQTVNSSYEQISAKQAKSLMEEETDYIIIDARTYEEYAAGHIENAVLIPEYEIEKRAEKALPDKDKLILVYCRSGRRSKIASEALVKLGYTNVKEFGGIIDWPYETVKEE